jgi:hypothetical protein
LNRRLRIVYNGALSRRWYIVELSAMQSQNTAPRLRGIHSVLICAALGGGIACADAAGPILPPPPNDIHLLALETFDGSGQAVHPDPAITPPSWGMSSSQLMVTPYPGGDASKENPSLFEGRSSIEWFIPEGVMNPIARPSAGYLSDPDELYNPDAGELWLYYRGVTAQNEVFLIRATSPTQWSAPVLVASAPNHSIVSPSVVRRDAGDWMMWSVNSGAVGCASATTSVELRRSTDGVNWSAPVTTDLAEADNYPWHIDVEWIPSRAEFWSVYNVKVAGSCTTAALHFATSVDGVHWVPGHSAVLARGKIPAFEDIVYRGAISYDVDADQVTLLYSGARFHDGGYTWRVATEQMTLAAFLSRVNALAFPGTGTGLTDAPPLTNADAP